MKKILFGLAALLCVVVIGAYWWLRSDRLGRSFQRVSTEQEGFGGRALVVSLPTQSPVIILNDIKGQLTAFETLKRELISRGRLTKDMDLQEDAMLIFNGNMVSRERDNRAILSAIIGLMRKNPYRAIYLSGPEERWVSAHDPMSREFLTGLPCGIYLFAEDHDELPIRISPTEYERFGRLLCTPVVDKGPIKAVCSLGDICYPEEGQLTRVLLSDAEHRHRELILGSPLPVSTLSFFGSEPPFKEPVVQK